MGTSTHIPEELLIEVLSRLPLKTLARFKCVSKQWQLLISNTIYATNPKLLIFSYSEDGSVMFHSLNQETCIESVCRLSVDNLLEFDTITVNSSCNGLLLIQINNQDDLFMWNPLTKYFRKVLTYCGLRTLDFDEQFLTELCYDSTEDVYKVVLVQKHRTYSWFSESFYVASCGDSSWEEIKVPYTIDNVHSGPFFKGYRHWVCKGHPRDYSYNEFLYPNNIVYFDPQKNAFIEVPMPQPKKDGDLVVGLGILDGCLCMTRWDEQENYEGNIEFLAMKEYGNGDSWDLMFVISNIPEVRCYGSMKPLLKTKKGEILVGVFIYDEGKSIKSYDTNGNFLRDIFLPENNDNFGCILYEESCYSPTGPDWEQIHPLDWNFSYNFPDVYEEIICYDLEECDDEEYSSEIEFHQGNVSLAKKE